MLRERPSSAAVSATLAVALLTAVGRGAYAAASQSPAMRAAVRDTERVLSGGDLDDYIANRLSDAYRSSMTDVAIKDHLRSLRRAVAGSGDIEISADSDWVRLMFSGASETTVRFRVDDAGMVSDLEIEPAAAADDRGGAARRASRALEGLALARDDDALLAFADEHIDPQLRSALGRSDLLAALRIVRRAAATAGTVSITTAPDGIGQVLGFRGGGSGADVYYAITPAPPYLIGALRVDTDDLESHDNAIELPAVDWDNVNGWLEAQAEAGFSGTVLLARDGETVLHESYGEADPISGRRNTKDTIFGIGSNVIDFTRIAVLMLHDEDRLHLDDVIGSYIDDVPDDRAAMTLSHLMSGRSGLPNFHHDPEVDANFDLSPLSRDEALARMMAAPLLFEPGSETSHSHSAFVLLAAIVEEVSEMPYTEFVRTRIIEPLGLDQTGFYGTADGFRGEQFAIGLGHERVGPVNIPIHWGEPSWLMMGSGGMVSTPADIYRLIQATYDGTLLSETGREVLGRGGMVAGASDRGYSFYFINDPDNTVILATNDGGDHSTSVARALAGLFRR